MPEFEIKDVWPGWKTVRLIGRGSFGAVYEIERDNYGHKERAALKVISIPQSASDIDDLMSDGYDEESITSRFEGYMQDIVREYSLMADMKGCANIVYCDDWKSIQHDDGMGWDIFIKMELLTALPRALGKTVTDEQVIKIGTDICSALVFCEKRNLLHRDIKPQNIFIAPDGTYKLGDFGIAKTAERTTSGTKTGTYKYMAPEVYNNQPYGGKADIYSLGLVLYWLLNERRTPFLPLPPTTPTSSEEDKARARRFNGEPVPAPANGSKELQRIVLKACAFDPNDRYQSAEEMLADLAKLDGARMEMPAVQVKSDVEMENEKSVGDCSKADEITKGTIALFGKEKKANEDTNSTEDGKTVGVLSDPPRTKSEATPKREKLPVVLAVIATLVLVVAGLLFVLLAREARTVEQENNTAESIIKKKEAAMEACEHSWRAATCTSPRICTICGATEGTALGHSWRAATCTSPRICTICGATEGTALGHSWRAATYSSPRTCTVCGATEGDVLPQPVTTSRPIQTPSSSSYPTAESIKELVDEGHANTVSDKNVKLRLPKDSEYLATPYRAIIISSRGANSGRIYIMPIPSGGNGNLGTINAGTEVWIVAKSGSFLFFVSDNGRLGWNGEGYFSPVA